MGNKKKVPYNHKLGNPTEACGLSEEVMEKKFDEFLEKLGPEVVTISGATELLESFFTKRELAYLYTTKMLRSIKKDPLEILFEALSGQ
jgi:hypothetical protein